MSKPPAACCLLLHPLPAAVQHHMLLRVCSMRYQHQQAEGLQVRCRAMTGCPPHPSAVAAVVMQVHRERA